MGGGLPTVPTTSTSLLWATMVIVAYRATIIKPKVHNKPKLDDYLFVGLVVLPLPNPELFCFSERFQVHNSLKEVRMGKNTEINKQSVVIC